MTAVSGVFLEYVEVDPTQVDVSTAAGSLRMFIERVARGETVRDGDDLLKEVENGLGGVAVEVVEIGVTIAVGLVVVDGLGAGKGRLEPDLFDEGHVANDPEQRQARGSEGSGFQLGDAEAVALREQRGAVKIEPGVELETFVPRGRYVRSFWRTEGVHAVTLRTARRNG